MAKRITVTALQPVHYDGRSHVRGSVFTTTPVDAASLTYRRKVRLGGQLSGATVPEHPSITRRMQPVEGFQPAIVSDDLVTGLQQIERALDDQEHAVAVAMVSAIDKDMTSEPEPPRHEPTDPTPPATGGDRPDQPAAPARGGRGGRRYQRRDMVAEPPGE